MNNLLESGKAILSTTKVHWLSLTESLSVDLLTRTPLQNEWSVHDLMQPLILDLGPWRPYFIDHDVSK